jgi:serine/threonine-protein kinase
MSDRQPSILDVDPETWAALNRLLDTALDLPVSERPSWLEALSPEHDALKPRLRALLSHAEHAGADLLPPTVVEVDVGAAEGAAAEAGPVPNEPIGSAPAADRSAVAPASDATPRTDVELSAGARLDRYEVRGLLGVGGMGRVYRALDPALGREVAIKTLARAFRDDASLLRRVEREARLLATLNHPNVAAIYGFELIAGLPYLILELVEGETLAERLLRGPLPREAAIAIALQLALALEEAHRKGIVHRDLKPGNVKLGREGRVKVLDFGIAKPVARVEDAGAGEATFGVKTRTGTVRGTAPYMSPEQVRGDPVDPRTDVWAFGCLLYEMLCGRRVFPGESSAEVVASVLRDPIDWTALPPDTPPALRRLLRRCLQRDPHERLQAIGDARLELSEVGRDESDDMRGAWSRHRRRAAAVALVAAATAGLAGVSIARRGEAPAPAVARLSLEMPVGLAIADDYAAPFALSPDGSRLVVLVTKEGTRPRLWQRRIDSIEAVPIAGTDGAWQPFFSPDGREVAFFADRKLIKVSLEGGTVTPLAEIGGNPRGASWGPDGTIVLALSPRAGLARIAASGGAPSPLTTLDHARGEGSHRWPQVLPGGRWAVFTVSTHNATFDDARIEAVSLDTGERRLLVGSGSHARYAAGRLIFAKAGRLFAVPFDEQTLTVRGTEAVVLEGIRYDFRTGGTHMALSENGTLVYDPGPATSLETHVAWVDAAGVVTRIGDTPRQFREPSLSPDGRRVAARIGTEAESDLWVLETGSGTLSRVSYGLSPHRPVWTADGRSITVATGKDGRFKLLTLSATGGGAAATLLESAHQMLPNAWTPDGRALVFQQRQPGTGWDLRVLDVGADGRPAGAARDLVSTPFEEVNAAVSRDGRLVAFESDELDSIYGIYVFPLASPGAKVRATMTGARFPRFGSREQLYYWYPSRARPGDTQIAEGLHRIECRETDAHVQLGRSAPLWGEAGREPAFVGRLFVGSYAGYDVDASGRVPRFLFLESGAATLETPLQRPVVVLNWLGAPRSRAAERR